MNLIFRIFVYLLLIIPANSLKSQNLSDVNQILQEADFNIRIGNWEKAIMQFDNAIQMDVNNAEPYVKRAMLLEKIGRYNEATKDYNEAIRINPYAFH